MKITRAISNHERVFELTDTELLRAHDEQEALFDYEDVLDQLDAVEEDGKYPSEFIVKMKGDESFVKGISEAYRQFYTWTEAGYDQMVRCVEEALKKAYVEWYREIVTRYTPESILGLVEDEV